MMQTYVYSLARTNLVSMLLEVPTTTQYRNDAPHDGEGV